MNQGFEPIASYYDWLVRILSGNLLFHNAISLFAKIDTPSTVLVIGDGSGKITEHLLSQHAVHTLYYVEISPTLIAKAEKRLTNFLKLNTLSTQIYFLKQDIFESDFPYNSFDLVLTPYFLDLWKEKLIEELVSQLTPSIKDSGVWYWSDFNPEVYKNGGIINLIYRWGINLLYRYFYWTVGIQTKRLPDMTTVFLKKKYNMLFQSKKGKGLLISMIWKKCDL